MQEENELEETEETSEDEIDESESLVSLIQDKQENISIEEDEDFSIALLTPEERESRRTQNRPDITWLKPAVIDGKFTLHKNDYLVMERRLLTQESRPWLDTKCYQIVTEPLEDGNMRLVECIRRCNALLNWKTAVEYGYDMRVPPRGRNPETLFESDGRRRRKKRFVAPQKQVVSTSDVQLQDNVQPPKRGRGRPKGSKNRPAEEIVKSKAEYRQKLREKRERRKKQ